MVDVLTQLRDACAAVAERARHVSINVDAIPAYAASLSLTAAPSAEDVEAPRSPAFWLTLDAINFGSGWFPTLRKPQGKSGYHTIAGGLRRRFESEGPWTADELQNITPEDIARALSQDPGHELMRLFARSLNDLGAHVADDYDGDFETVVGSSAASLVETLATWRSFEDVSTYDGLTIPFLKRAQIAAADLARANAAHFDDLDRLTMFADNLVPHVLRLDGILSFDSDLVARIDQQQLIEHDSSEEVEIRACAVHAVELLVGQLDSARAADIDQLLWLRGQQPSYKAVPRHRSRTTAY